MRVRVRIRVRAQVRIRVRARARARVPGSGQGQGSAVRGGGDHSGEDGARRQLREEGAWSGLGWGFGLKGCRVRVRVTVGLARLG